MGNGERGESIDTERYYTLLEVEYVGHPQRGTLLAGKVYLKYKKTSCTH